MARAPFRFTMPANTVPITRRNLSLEGYDENLSAHRAALSNILNATPRGQETQITPMLRALYEPLGYSVVWRGNSNIPQTNSIENDNIYNQYAKTDYEIYPNSKRLPVRTNEDYVRLRDPFRIAEEEELPPIFVEVKDYRTREEPYDDISKLSTALNAKLLASIEPRTEHRETVRNSRSERANFWLPSRKPDLNKAYNCWFFPSDKIDGTRGRGGPYFQKTKFLDASGAELSAYMDYQHMDEIYNDAEMYCITRYNWYGNPRNGIDVVSQFTNAKWDPLERSDDGSIFVPLTMWTRTTLDRPLNTLFTGGMPIRSIWTEATSDPERFYGAAGYAKLVQAAENEKTYTKQLDRKIFTEKLSPAEKRRYHPMNLKQRKIDAGVESDLAAEISKEFGDEVLTNTVEYN